MSRPIVMDERFYCPKCLIPVEYSPDVNRYLCGGTCDKRVYSVQEVIPSERLMNAQDLKERNGGARRK